jgi:hypothetical protein
VSESGWPWTPRDLIHPTQSVSVSASVGDPLDAKKKKKNQENIEIPVTPMLDMAFQL